MAIVSLAGVVAGMRPLEKYLKAEAITAPAGVLRSLLYTAGVPGAGVAPTPGMAGAALTTYAGQIPWTNPVSGNSYLARFSASGVPGSAVLYDRLWHNSGINPSITSLQVVNSAAWPSRVTAIGGNGVMVAIEHSTPNTFGVDASLSIGYTNQNNVSGRVGSCTTPASSVAGTFAPFSLQAGDTGIRSIQSVTLSTTQSGASVMHLVAYREITSVDVKRATRRGVLNALSGGFMQVPNDIVPCLLLRPSAATANLTVQGQVGFAQG